MLREALEANADSIIDITEGGECDIDLGGVPASSYHNQTSTLTIPKDSALNTSIVSRGPFLDKSRDRRNSWNTLPLPSDATVKDVRRRQSSLAWHNNDSFYQSEHDPRMMLEHQPEMVQHSISVYTLRKLYLDGLCAYHMFITPEEERAICAELVALLEGPSVAYIPEECRYCANIFEQRLGMPQKDPLAFSFDDAPTLRLVLHRAFSMGIIPSLPNAAQVSEFVGPFSGYPMHRKHTSIGSYFGILNLVSRACMSFSHVCCPWRPKLVLMPRAVYVFQEPFIQDYAGGYNARERPVTTFRLASRLTKDYRIEVMFATVDAPAVPLLGDALRLTEYAKSSASTAQGASGAVSDGPLRVLKELKQQMEGMKFRPIHS